MVKALRGLSPPAGQQREVGQQRGVSAGRTCVLLLQPRPDTLKQTSDSGYRLIL